MPSIETTYLEKCTATLEKALEMLKQSKPQTIEYDMYRSACVKEFEIILEMSGKLLRKALKPFFHSSAAVDALYFKDVFRHAAKHGIITLNACEKWLVYRDSRNVTAHDYGAEYAEGTLKDIEEFIQDSKELANSLNK